MGKHVKASKPGAVTPAMRFEHEAQHEQMALSSRFRALETSMQMRQSGLSTDYETSAIVEDAEKFEEFLLGEKLSEPIKKFLKTLVRLADQNEASETVQEGFTDDSTGFRDQPEDPRQEVANDDLNIQADRDAADLERWQEWHKQAWNEAINTALMASNGYPDDMSVTVGVVRERLRLLLK